MTMGQPVNRNRVFICYNQADKKWLELLLLHLRPQIRDEGLDVFAGDELVWGVRWREEIEQALHSARIAILLVSKNFLASEFIVREELPPLLAAAAKEEVKILSLLVGPSSWPKALSQYQAVNPPSRTLSEMSEPEIDRLMVKLVKFIRKEIQDVLQKGVPQTDSDGQAQSRDFGGSESGPAKDRAAPLPRNDGAAGPRRDPGGARRAFPSVDVLIIVALKEEYLEAKNVNTGAIDDTWDERRGTTGFTVALRSYRKSSGAPMLVALTWALEMRGVATANAAWPLILEYGPRVLAMCGVCAGRREETNLGDVIVGDILYTYDTGAVIVEYDKDGAKHERFKGEPSPYRMPAIWKRRAEFFTIPADAPWLAARPRTLEEQELWLLGQLFAGADAANHAERRQRCPDWAKVIARLRLREHLTSSGLALTEAGRIQTAEYQLLHPDGPPPRQDVRVRVGPLATGNSVVRDTQIFQRLSTSMRKVLGVEMEAAAIGAISHVTNLPMLVMKGVMDHADNDKDDGFKAFAARASAECLIAFLRESIDSLNGSDIARTPQAAGAGPGISSAPPPSETHPPQADLAAKNELTELLKLKFRQSERESLLFRMGLDPEDIKLRSDDREEFARAMVLHAENKGRLADLWDAVGQERPTFLPGRRNPFR